MEICWNVWEHFFVSFAHLLLSINEINYLHIALQKPKIVLSIKSARISISELMLLHCISYHICSPLVFQVQEILIFLSVCFNPICLLICALRSDFEGGRKVVLEPEKINPSFFGGFQPEKIWVFFSSTLKITSKRLSG